MPRRADWAEPPTFRVPTMDDGRFLVGFMPWDGSKADDGFLPQSGVQCDTIHPEGPMPRWTSCICGGCLQTGAGMEFLAATSYDRGCDAAIEERKRLNPPPKPIRFKPKGKSKAKAKQVA